MNKFLTITMIVGLISTQIFSRDLEFGTLKITTTPDSAQVILNDLTEQDSTPYTNKNMVLGKHRVTLKPKSSIFKAAQYEPTIQLNKTTEIQHTFLYRNKSFLNENLSLEPFRMQFETGVSYKNEWATYIDSGDVNFSNDEINHNTTLPVILRLGLPNDFELHTTFPFYNVHLDSVDGEYGLGDVNVGIKYTYRKYNTAANLEFKFWNADPEFGGINAPSIAFSLITLQSYLGAELLAQAGYEYTFTDIDENKIDPADQAFVYIQAGYLLGRVLPFLAIEGQYTLPGSIDNEEVGDASYVAGLQIGAIFDITQNFTFQAGIPFSVLGSNANKYIGINLSASYSFKVGSNKSRSASKSIQASGIVPQFHYDSTTAKTSSSFLIFDESEVTNAEYREFCDRTQTRYPTDPGFDGIDDYFNNPEYKDYPVVNVSYEDAIRYAKWKDKRLPTADEWKAEFKSTILDTAHIVSNRNTPESARSKQQLNGLYHVIGNVSEWVIESGVGQSSTTAFHAGCSYNMPNDRCTSPDRLVDIASAKGAKFIGFRCVTDIK